MGPASAMMARSIWASAVVTALFVGACGDDDGPRPSPDAGEVCDVAELRTRLEAATAGSVVSLRACTYAGPLVVPAGVTLQGRGRDATTVVSGDDDAAIVLAPGDATSRVEGLGVRVEGHAGIQAEGAGSVEIADVRVVVTAGIGVAVGSRASLVMTDVEVTGTTDPSALGALAPDVGRRDAPTYGVVVLDVGSATLTRVNVHAFARAGAVFVRSTLAWTTGEVTAARGVGIGVWDGAATLDTVRLAGTLRGRVLSTMAVLAADGAALTTRDCVVEDNDSIGVLHDDATGEHGGITVSGSRGPGIWTQRSAGLRVLDGHLSANRIGGVVAIDADDVHIEDTTIDATALGIPPGDFGDREPTADGVHALREDGGALDVELVRVTFADNARVGVLLDANGGTFGSSSLSDVEVGGSGEALGAVAQRVMDLPSGWDDSVMRLGVTATNDERFADLLSAVGIVMPPELPEGLDTGTLSALLGP